MLSVSDSPTAQIFHIVDQFSQWDIYTHDQYARWAAATHLLDQRDRELLQQHAEMRKNRGWGQRFEQTILVEDSIEDAVAKGVAADFLSAAERIQSATSCLILLRSWNHCCGNAGRKSPPHNNSSWPSRRGLHNCWYSSRV